MKKLIPKGDKHKEAPEYTKYRWFFTSDNVLVIGGKNAQQNEETISNLIKSNKNYLILHTKEPGSPFAIIHSENPSETSIKEAAVFTGCFSRAWREKKKKILIDIFQAAQITKRKGMSIGTFGVSGGVKTIAVEPKLYLVKQNKILRAVPQKTKNSICIIPGNIEKKEFAEQIAIKLEIPLEEAIQAIPSGGSKLCSY